jgi:putative ABC transport system permease protein
MPPDFHFPHRVDGWAPLTLREADFADRTDTYLEGVARLRDGVTFERASAELAAISARIERQYAESVDIRGGVLRVRDEMGPRARLLVLALCGAALCILLLACANLASLLLARAASRGREMAVRAALGGGRERLVRQLVTECVGLALVGGAVGVAVAMAGVPLLGHLVPPWFPVAERPAVDARVLAIALLVVVATALLFGVMPGTRAAASRRGVFDALRDGARAGGGRTQRLRAALVVAEVAASVVLLISSGLLIRAVWRIQAVDPGFRPERVLTARTALPLPAYAAAARREQFYARVLGEVRSLPGVTGAAYTTGLPLRQTGGIVRVVPAGVTIAPNDWSAASTRFVTPQYFATLGIPLRRGRDVAETDTRAQPLVAVVSESFVERYWPGAADPIGKRFTVADEERTVVGVVGDVRVRGREREAEPQLYLPYRQANDSALTGYAPKDLVVRSAAPAATLLPAIRRAVLAADPEQPVSDVATLSEVLGAETAPRVTQLRLLGVLSAVALLIAGVGIHGLLTFTVSRRSQELAVRRALGAQARSVIGGVLGEGLLLAVTGIAVGVALAYPAARAMGALLAGVEPADPPTVGAVAALCLVTAVVGCVRPAVRAARVDPLAALRTE